MINLKNANKHKKMLGADILLVTSEEIVSADDKINICKGEFQWILYLII